jgi:hypothetical protein
MSTELSAAVSANFPGRMFYATTSPIMRNSAQEPHPPRQRAHFPCASGQIVRMVSTTSTARDSGAGNSEPASSAA